MKSFNVITSENENANGRELKIVYEGDLGLPNATDIQKSLAKKIKNQEKIEIIGRDITSIDLSFIQILEACRKSIIAENKSLKIVLDLPYDLKILLANAGISYPGK